MAKQVCQVWFNQIKVADHLFVFEPEGKSDYRAIVSYTNFLKRHLLSASKTDTIAVRGLREDEWEWNKKQEIRFAHLLPPTQTYEHDSLWDMYRAIGYDYKSKRWISGE